MTMPVSETIPCLHPQTFKLQLLTNKAMSDIPGFLPLQTLVEAYPNAKFILTTREPQSWLLSVRNTIGQATRRSRTFPVAFFKYFDRVLWTSQRLGRALCFAIFPDGNTADEAGTLRRYEEQSVTPFPLPLTNGM